MNSGWSEDEWFRVIKSELDLIDLCCLDEENAQQLIPNKHSH